MSKFEKAEGMFAFAGMAIGLGGMPYGFFLMIVDLIAPSLGKYNTIVLTVSVAGGIVYWALIVRMMLIADIEILTIKPPDI